MKLYFTLTLVSVALLGTACADSRLKDATYDQVDLLPAIEQEGTIYTPIDRSEEGCVLYNIRIPGGQAPAMLVYRSMEGEFSAYRPDQCVTDRISQDESSRKYSGQTSE